MGELIKTFTYPRNAFGRSTEGSALKALEVLSRTEAKSLLRNPSDPTRYKDEPFNDMRNLHAIVAGQPADPHITNIGWKFRDLAETSPPAAWRWLLTRSLWLYHIPNGTEAHVNNVARKLEISFNFFDMVTRLAVRLSALPAPRNVLYFDELLAVLDDDASWLLSNEELHDRLLAKRRELAIKDEEDHAPLLGSSNLEGKYSVGRDNLNTVFSKGFLQTGLFSFAKVGASNVGLRLDASVYTDPVIGRRLRFILDHPRPFIE